MKDDGEEKSQKGGERRKGHDCRQGGRGRYKRDHSTNDEKAIKQLVQVVEGKELDEEITILHHMGEGPMTNLMLNVKRHNCHKLGHLGLSLC